jgi:hypothetical protein
MPVDLSSPEPALGMLPEVDARALLGKRNLALRILRPPYPAVGVGALRVLRVIEREGRTEIVAGYDGYERLDAGTRASGAR